MLHQYNYPLHFLTYQQQQQNLHFESATTTAIATKESSSICAEDEQHHQQKNHGSTSSAAATAAANKSFTIAAILGLKGSNQESEGLNLSMHHQHQQERQIFHPQQSLRQFATTSRLNTSVRGLKHQHHQHNVLAAAAAANNNNNNNNGSGKKSCKSKRVRTIFTPEQLERLEAEFERQQYMVGPERLYLAHTLQLTEAQVKVWFQNRRIKWRKHHLELTHQRLAVLKQQQILMDHDANADGHEEDTNSSSISDNNT